MRVHLFELEDQAWFPQRLRRYLTDYLAFNARMARGIYAPVFDRLASFLAQNRLRTVVDLGAGSGGPAVAFLQHTRAQVTYVLTDYYPNVEAWRQLGLPQVQWREESIDATTMTPSPDALHVLFNCFHHFPPAAAQRILGNAYAARAPIAVVETVERSFLGLIGVLFGVLFMLLSAPFVRPFSVGRLLLTYLLVLPLTLWWDGSVSCLRAYTQAELQALVAPMSASDYRWEIVRVGRVMLLLGAPVHHADRPPA